MIFCPVCAVKHGRPNYATPTGEQWEPLVCTVLDLSNATPRRVLIVFRARCVGCDSQIVTEQAAYQDAEGTWRIESIAQ